MQIQPLNWVEFHREPCTVLFSLPHTLPLSCPWGVQSDSLDNVFLWLEVTALDYHSVPAMPLSQRRREEVAAMEKERVEDVKTDMIDFGFYSCFFIWGPVVCKGRLCGRKIFQRGENTVFSAQLDTLIEEILPGLNGGPFLFVYVLLWNGSESLEIIWWGEEWLSFFIQLHLWGWLRGQVVLLNDIKYTLILKRGSWASPYQCLI